MREKALCARLIRVLRVSSVSREGENARELFRLSSNSGLKVTKVQVMKKIKGKASSHRKGPRSLPVRTRRMAGGRAAVGAGYP